MASRLSVEDDVADLEDLLLRIHDDGCLSITLSMCWMGLAGSMGDVVWWFGVFRGGCGSGIQL